MHYFNCNNIRVYGLDNEIRPTVSGVNNGKRPNFRNKLHYTYSLNQKDFETGH